MGFGWFKGQANTCQPWVFGGLNGKLLHVNHMAWYSFNHQQSGGNHGLWMV